MIEDIVSARRSLRGYLAYADGKLPADTFEKLETLADSPSPVDQICRSAELLYARRDELDATGRDVAGELAAFAATNGWHGMADGNRGGLIYQALKDATPGASDPAPATEFVKAAENAQSAPMPASAGGNADSR